MSLTIRFADLDLFALLDSDSDEAKTFTTYLGYWLCLAEQVQETHGDEPAASVLAALRALPSFRALPGKGPPRNPEQVRSLLLNGWTSEGRLHLIDIEDTKRLWLANHGAPIDAYYASSRMASAWLCIRDGAIPETHGKLLRAVSALIVGQRLLPYPWNLTCSSVTPSPVYDSFPSAPEFCSNLASRADPLARAAMLLRTTRHRGLEGKVEEVKRRLKKNRAPNGERRRQDERMAATTVFDFAWRMRARSNYGDPAMFYVGTLSADRSSAYAASVRTWTNATMALFEALIAQRAGVLLEEAAVHYIARDRSGIAERLIASRLRALGLLTTGG